MDLRLPPIAPGRYSSLSQLARVRTEEWAGRELFCLECTAERLEVLRANTAVHDYSCGGCGTNYQLKSKGGPFGRSVSNSGYEKKIAAIREGRAPNYVFLSYDGTPGRVVSAFAVPGRYFSESVIQRRAPLGPSARRKGWVGSNILLGEIGRLGRVPLVENEVGVEPKIARAHWQRLRFMDRLSPNLRGWLNDVWTEVENLGRPRFTLHALYARAPTLAEKHPGNQHVQPKIRQQLQLLRDHGFLIFHGRGEYEIRRGPWKPTPS